LGAYDPRMTDSGLARFNALPPAAAASRLRACCAAPDWITSVTSARPYPDRAALLARAEQVLAGLDWEQVRIALDAHPRIGERAAGADREAAWSRTEQSGMDSASADVRAALAQANRAYEQRFGYVFLIFASGRTDTDMLAAARQRLDHDDETERAVVRTELARIVALRLNKLLEDAA
jgi:2-oxo-4-hydroxy-4-carboxy-5-ureidoimidazoline decarboxylase